MDTLYYSNFCKHSQKIIQFLVNGNLTDQVNFICVDKRKRDPNNNQLFIILENGSSVIMPPNIQSVPALLLVRKNYNVVLGENIIQHFSPQIREKAKIATQYHGEPVGVPLMQSNQGMSIVSEQYTMYNMSPEELSSKGRGGNRQMHNYMSAADEAVSFIPTPPDNYRPDKLSENVTLDSLQQQRNADIQKSTQGNSPFVPHL